LALAWPAATRATGNRELFFPFAMQLAAVVVCRGGRPGAVRAIVKDSPANGTSASMARLTSES
jgi:hypothetical protein